MLLRRRNLFPDYVWISCSSFVFSHALRLLVGWQEDHPAYENWVMRYWCGYLSTARCKWSLYGPADATATLSSLASLKSGMVYLSGAGLPRSSWKKPLNGCSLVILVVAVVEAIRL